MSRSWSSTDTSATTSTSSQTVTLIFKQRPPTANKQRGKNHRWATAAETDTWRKMGAAAIREQIANTKIPAQVATISAEIRQLCKDGRHHQDIGACMPAWKAAEDGLVDAHLIPDDTAAHVTQVTFNPPKIVGFNGLQIDIHWTTR